MKFYDRTKELAILEQTREIAYNNHSQMTVLTGRRRIGKTSLILKHCNGTPTVYMFVGRSNEAVLCSEFAQIASKELNTYIPDEITSFVKLFEILMEQGRHQSFTLVIDEFQEFYFINQSIYSGMQDVWDRHKDSTKVNLIVSGSVYTLMTHIFQDAREPLYGRADSILKLQPFSTSVLKEILADYKPKYTNDDLLALYTFTGGIPKYIELFMEKGCTDTDSMIDFITQADSPFMNEGRALLIQEFGRKYGNYFSILTAIANGKNTLPELESIINSNPAGFLKRLEEDYELISKKRPIMAKESSQTVRYEISDLFLRFWFRYFSKYRSLIEMNNLDALSAIIKNDYPTYSGLILEMYFRQKMSESGKYIQLGSWWENQRGGSANPNEIDIVGIYINRKKVLLAEVKRQRKNFKNELFEQKVDAIRKKLFYNYEIEKTCLTLDDM